MDTHPESNTSVNPTPRYSHSDSNTKLTMMSIADVRSFVTSELSRLKDEISDLYDKFNALKDMHTADKMALISQLNQEFSRINTRMGDYSLAIQRITGESEHADEKMSAQIQLLASQVDNKILTFKSEMKDFDQSSAIAALGLQIKTISETMAKRVEELQKELRQELEKTNKKVTSLMSKDTALSSKVAKLSWKLGLIIAGIAWLFSTYGSDILKNAFSSAVTKAAPAVSATPNVQVKVDTQITKSGK